MRRRLMAFLTITALVFACEAGRAADLPRASMSPVAGVSFDDPPIPLPVAPNFQIAMQTAAGELGMSCRSVESYGWRMQQSEQQRVEKIFFATVTSLRKAGYQLEPRRPAAVSGDITVFTAHRADQDLLMMWSAGELGLVLLLCDSRSATNGAARIGFFMPGKQKSGGEKKFTPLGLWQGTFACAQGLSGGKLNITAVRGKHIEGVFHFYATRRNPGIPSGGYYVSGAYDPQGKRVLLDPGNWIKRPKGFEAAPIIGGFDAASMRFSGVFRDVAGCTSFEARHVGVQPAVKKQAQAKAKAQAVKQKTDVPSVAPLPAVDNAAAAPLPPVVNESIPEPPPLSPAAPVVDAAPAAPPKPDSAVPPPPTKVEAMQPPEVLGAPPQMEQPPLVGHVPFPTIDAPAMPTPPDKLPDPPILPGPDSQQ